MTPFRCFLMPCGLEGFPPPPSILPRDLRIQRGPGKVEQVSGAGSAQSTQSSAHLMKISAIRNPIPEPPPVMKATLSLRKQEALYLLIFFNRKNFKEIDAC